ncbi:hypothetical protein Ddc_00983 [Ditylenchus destructor]|nr:hypothetical protein Ddc_00983 [Ditylenchus destructor]
MICSYSGFVPRHNTVSSNSSENTLVDEKFAAHEDAILDQIFSVVNLPSVQFKSTTPVQPKVVNSEKRNGEVEEEKEQKEALAELDQILDGLNSTSISSLTSLVESNNGGEKEPLRMPHLTTETNGFNNSHEEHIVQICSQNNDGDRVCTIYRTRSNTLDSLISVAESRYGSFDVHDADGHIRNEEINLFHDEVAYLRPRKTDKRSKTEARSNNAHSKPQKAKHQKRSSPVSKAQIRSDLILERQPVHNKIKRETSIEVKKRVNALTKKASQLTGNTNKRISIYEEDVGFSEVLERQLDGATLLGQENGVNYLQPHLCCGDEWDTDNMIQKIFIGGNQESTDDDKVILLFGPKGSGKTSIVTTILNYLYDVKREHEFRLCMQIPNDLQPTPGLTAYTFNNTIYPFRITIVDTPGVPELDGYTETSKLIQTWFQKELYENGKFRLDAMGIVLTSIQEELGVSFIRELTAVQKLFGDDLKSNVMPLITSAEVLPQPVAIRSLVMAKVNFLEYYKIENASFLPLRSDGNALKHSLLHKHTTFALERLFQDVQDLIHPILAVLRNSPQ